MCCKCKMEDIVTYVVNTGDSSPNLLLDLQYAKAGDLVLRVMADGTETGPDGWNQRIDDTANWGAAIPVDGRVLRLTSAAAGGTVTLRRITPCC